MRHLLAILLTAAASMLGADIRVVPVERSPEPSSATTRIIFPRPYENKRKNPVNIQLRISDFRLGVMTINERAKTIYNNPDGQSIHVVIDNEPYLAYYQSVEDSNENGHDYHAKILSFGIPFNLTPGQHVIRCFPVRSYGESLKGDRSFDAEIFYFKNKKKSDTMNVDLSKPYLTYNEPQGRYPFSQSEPLLLDFLLSNCDLSPSGYKVRLTIDKKVVATLTKWVPYYLYGLSKGNHRVKLELLDKNNAIVHGYFNVVEREIFLD